jgi:hypothetical protein
VNSGGENAADILLPPREQVLKTIGPAGLGSLVGEADEIVGGKARLFGAELVELGLAFNQALVHWSQYEENAGLLSSFHAPYNDVKFIWEPARFGFAFTLGRAYHLTGDEKYRSAFWQHFEAFTAGNPPYVGPNWMSGQEVALRLMSYVWAASVFDESAENSLERRAALEAAIAVHAARIPPTLIYARSQNNNHLLIEAAGLLTASLALPTHPQAAKWRRLGVKWLNWCFEKQFDGMGEHVQHSTNYQRLMLQAALWVKTLTTKETKEHKAVFSEVAVRNLARATRWLLALTEPETGHAANIGANDGANILRLTYLPFADFRPTLQAASLAFLGAPAFELGPWDETAEWLGQPAPFSGLPVVPWRGAEVNGRLVNRNSWCNLRAVRLSSRPSHADQMHLDLWWRGLNIALDPGTYLYNADPPWNNALTSALVHNTVTVDGLDQMTRAAKFLYLDWAQAKVIERDEGRIIAEHDGYGPRGVRHRRSVTVLESGWRVIDELRAENANPHTYRLHWLLADCEWTMDDTKWGNEIRLMFPVGEVVLSMGVQPESLVPRISLVRAGEHRHGAGAADTIRGWASPTYGVKLPALSLALEVESTGTVSFTSEFRLP